MKKTIRLDGNRYFIKENQVFRYDFPNVGVGQIKEVPTKYKVGNKAVLISKTDSNSKKSKPDFYLHFDIEGVSGNSNPSIKKTIGWRGTYNNVITDAHGVVTITKFTHYVNGDIKITVK